MLWWFSSLRKRVKDKRALLSYTQSDRNRKHDTAETKTITTAAPNHKGCLQTPSTVRSFQKDQDPHMSLASICRLPVELQLQIFQNLDTANDLLALQLTHPTFRSAYATYGNQICSAIAARRWKDIGALDFLNMMRIKERCRFTVEVLYHGLRPHVPARILEPCFKQLWSLDKQGNVLAPIGLGDLALVEAIDGVLRWRIAKDLESRRAHFTDVALSGMEKERIRRAVWTVLRMTRHLHYALLRDAEYWYTGMDGDEGKEYCDEATSSHREESGEEESGEEESVVEESGDEESDWEVEEVQEEDIDHAKRFCLRNGEIMVCDDTKPHYPAEITMDVKGLFSSFTLAEHMQAASAISKLPKIFDCGLGSWDFPYTNLLQRTLEDRTRNLQPQVNYNDIKYCMENSLWDETQKLLPVEDLASLCRRWSAGFGGYRVVRGYVALRDFIDSKNEGLEMWVPCVLGISSFWVWISRW